MAFKLGCAVFIEAVNLGCIVVEISLNFVQILEQVRTEVVANYALVGRPSER